LSRTKGFNLLFLGNPFFIQYSFLPKAPLFFQAMHQVLQFYPVSIEDAGKYWRIFGFKGITIMEIG